MAGWAKVLPLFVEDVVRALQGHLATHPDEEIYAAGFYAPYLDGDTVDLPELAVGHRRDVRELAGDLWHSDWNPPSSDTTSTTSAPSSTTPGLPRVAGWRRVRRRAGSAESDGSSTCS